MLSKVLFAIRTCTDWYCLGAWLGLECHTLDTISETHPHCPERCKVAMINKWLQGKDHVGLEGGPSWQQLASVLRELGHGREAQKIEDDILPTHSTS